MYKHVCGIMDLTRISSAEYTFFFLQKLEQLTKRCGTGPYVNFLQICLRLVSFL